MSKTNYDISKQMHHDLIAAYKQVYASCWTQHQAYERMVEQPAPRYYISPKQACSVIRDMMRGDFERVDMMMPLRREMYYSLFNEVVKMTERTEYYGKSLSYIMKFAVLRPAPKFFISPTRAKIIRNSVRNGVYDEDGKVIDAKQPSYITCRERKRKKMEERRKWMLARAQEKAQEAEG